MSSNLLPVLVLPHPNLVKSAQTEKRKKLENDNTDEMTTTTCYRVSMRRCSTATLICDTSYGLQGVQSAPQEPHPGFDYNSNNNLGGEEGTITNNINRGGYEGTITNNIIRGGYEGTITNNII